MNNDANHADPSGEVPKFNVRPLLSPGLRAALKARTDAAFRPIMIDMRKALGIDLPRPELGRIAKFAAPPIMADFSKLDDHTSHVAYFTFRR